MYFSGGRPGYEYYFNAPDHCVPCGVDMYSIGSDGYEMCSPCPAGTHTDGLMTQDSCIPLNTGLYEMCSHLAI